jgi:3-deoxy-D-manno-octulosonic acid kinase
MSRQWPLGSEVKRKDLTGGAMLYDASRAGNAAPGWFEPAFWQERGELDGEARGRGTVYFTRNGEKGLVLRHYHRGGLIAKLVQDQYIWRGPFETRAFREWQLLYHLHRAGLPVPTPVAARYRRHGLTYTADLITERLMDSQSLASVLRKRGIPILGWITIGRCIRTFHDLGVCHADLNAHNILLVGDDSVYLIDFDRGRLRKPGLWCDSNLVRLRRSLEKITYKLPPEHFSEADWHGLLDGYRQAAGAARASGAGTPPGPASTSAGPTVNAMSAPVADIPLAVASTNPGITAPAKVPAASTGPANIPSAAASINPAVPASTTSAPGASTASTPSQSAWPLPSPTIP